MGLPPAGIYPRRGAGDDYPHIHGDTRAGALAAGTTCDTLAVAQLPRVRCSIVAVVSPKLTRVTVRVAAIGNPLIPADSVIFERSISGDVVPPLNTP